MERSHADDSQAPSTIQRACAATNQAIYGHIVPLSARALRHHYLLAQEHTSLTETHIERILLKGSLDGLDGQCIGGSVQHDLAHRTPDADGPSGRVGLRLTPVASALRSDLDVEACQWPCCWGDELLQ